MLKGLDEDHLHFLARILRGDLTNRRFGADDDNHTVHLDLAGSLPEARDRLTAAVFLDGFFAQVDLAAAARADKLEGLKAAESLDELVEFLDIALGVSGAGKRTLERLLVHMVSE